MMCSLFLWCCEQRPELEDCTKMLKTTLAGVPVDCCIYNASGPRTHTVEALEEIGASEAGVVVSKSATLIRRDGNPAPRSIDSIWLGEYCCGALNSEGLPNMGIDHCKLLIFVINLAN
jgi:dihydroorotate dehydrogenase (fumarate)